MNLFVLITLFAYFTVGCYTESGQFRDNSAPIFRGDYIVSGEINIHDSGLKEPFTVWYSPSTGQSRIDYYHGLSSLIVRSNEGQYGRLYKLLPVTTESVRNAKICVAFRGNSWHRFHPGSKVPTRVSLFKKVREEKCANFSCDVWSFDYKHHGKIFIYEYLVTKGEHKRPFRFVKRGYDTITHKRFDWYSYDYKYFKQGEISSQIFQVNNTKCGGYPKHYRYNSDIDYSLMEELDGLLTNDPIKVMFHEFNRQHNKQYSSWLEKRQREINFRNNVRYINSVNRQGKSYKLKINQFAVLSDNELKMISGRRVRYHRLTEALIPWRYNVNENIPEHVDWRQKGALMPIRNQAFCGSCYAFSTVASLESAIYLKTGKFTALSEQNIMDCSWGFGNYACDGGMEFSAFQYIAKHGITDAKTYGKYLGSPGLCHVKKDSAKTKIAGYSIILPLGNVKATKIAVAKKGPLAAGVNVHSRAFHFYSSGIFEDKGCKNDLLHLNHAVNVVGYGKQGNDNYWIIRNSWSVHWGEKGYMKLKFTEANECGIATFTSFPVIDKPKK